MSLIPKRTYSNKVNGSHNTHFTFSLEVSWGPSQSSALISQFIVHRSDSIYFRMSWTYPVGKHLKKVLLADVSKWKWKSPANKQGILGSPGAASSVCGGIKIPSGLEFVCYFPLFFMPIYIIKLPERIKIFPLKAKGQHTKDISSNV